MAELTTDAQALSSEGWFVADSFSFGVEREMKDGGDAASTDTSGPQASTFIIEFDRPVDPSPQSAADDAASSLGSAMGFAPDPFDFKATEADEVDGAAFVRFREAGNKQIQELNEISGSINDATAQLTISGTISDSSAVDGRYSFVFDGNPDTSGGHTGGASIQPYGDFLGGVFVGQDSNAMTSVEPTAPYFDGRLLTAQDLTREQVYVSDTGFDLV